MKFIRKDILKLTIPIITEQTFIMSMGMVNTMMAGRLGKEAVSAIGMVDSINNIFIAFFSALAVGGTVIVAHYAGRKDIKKANEATKQALFSSLFLALIITVLTGIFKTPLISLLYGSADKEVIKNAYTYLGITLFTYPLISVLLVANGVLRGAGDTKTPAKITIGMNIINVILGYIFIYGININVSNFYFVTSGMGVKGAALAIALARSIGAITILLILIRGSRIVKLKNLKKYKPNFELLKPIFNVGIPASVESLLFNGGKLITQIYIVSMGTIAIASNSIGGSVVSMLNVPGVALSIAATTLVGQNMGKGDCEEAKRSLLYLNKITVISFLVLSLLSFPMAYLLASLYTDNHEIIKMTGKLIKLNAFCMPLWPFSFVLPAGLKGAGDGKYTMITSIIGMWLFRITLGYFLGIPMGLGVAGVWIGMYTDWVVRGTLYYIRLKNGKWNKHVLIKSL